MNKNNSYPKSYNLDTELKAQIAYESLCENYTKKLIDDMMSFLRIPISKLSEDEVVEKILGALNTNNK